MSPPALNRQMDNCGFFMGRYTELKNASRGPCVVFAIVRSFCSLMTPKRLIIPINQRRFYKAIRGVQGKNQNQYFFLHHEEYPRLVLNITQIHTPIFPDETPPTSDYSHPFTRDQRRATSDYYPDRKQSLLIQIVHGNCPVPPPVTRYLDMAIKDLKLSCHYLAFFSYYSLQDKDLRFSGPARSMINAHKPLFDKDLKTRKCQKRARRAHSKSDFWHFLAGFRHYLAALLARSC